MAKYEYYPRIDEDSVSKIPAIELLQSMGYEYISREDCLAQRGGEYNVLLRDVLRRQLIRLNRFEYGGEEHVFSSATIEKAISDLDVPLMEGLITTSEKIYDSLLLGKSYPEILPDGRTLSFNLKYIDWKNQENNVFHVTEEFQTESSDKEHNARPDIVLFVNGIPFAVIECKAPDRSVEDGVVQTIRNQTDEYIPQLFKFAQVVISTNKNDAMYATTGTAKKFWQRWREEDRGYLAGMVSRHIDRTPAEQDRAIISLLSPERLMYISKHCVIFDESKKKICRYQQFFGLRDIVKTISHDDYDGNRQSGFIWHTQGSGKSLTMVMFAKYVLTEMSQLHPRVVLVTDRRSLDKQIGRTFVHAGFSPARATSGKHLIDLIRDGKADIITSVVNKFNTVENCGVKVEGRDIFLLVDEGHRSQYGSLSTKMRLVFPNACYIGFTGTPLMKKEKNTAARFGKLINKYTIKDGVDDKAIVPLIYEGRFVEQTVDEANIDMWFEEVTKNMTDKEKDDIKRKWSGIKRIASTDARIRRIALDINMHFRDFYKDTGFNAMLATNSKKDAIRYYRCFEEMGDLRTAVDISAPDMREGLDDIDESTDNEVRAFWGKMMRKYKTEESYDETLQAQFVDGDIDIMIVCSKLLAGFDAPLAQVMYIDKDLKEHVLLQAIARVNRIADGKEYGLIVDYKGLLGDLDKALVMYSDAGLDKFDLADIDGAVIDVINVVASLRGAYSHLCDQFRNIGDKKDTEAIEVSLADEKEREDFYDKLCVFGKNLSVVLSSENATAAIPRTELKELKAAFIFYSKIRSSVKIRYNDAVDNKEFEPQMQSLLDRHLHVADLKRITEPVDILNTDAMEKELVSLGTLRSKADAIQSRMARSISEKYDENPAYYESFSKRIREALELYKQKILSDAEYLKKMRNIMGDYVRGVSSVSYPEELRDNVHAQAFYGVLCSIFAGESRVASPFSDLLPDIALDITTIVKENVKVGFADNKTVLDRIDQAIDDLFYKYEREQGLKLSFDTIDKIMENIKIVALRRFS